MQRIVLRFRKGIAAGALSHSDLRACLQRAADQSRLLLAENRRSLLLCPPLPPGATSEAEQSVLELLEPNDPSEVARLLNMYLPDGIFIEGAWIARPGFADENPSSLDMAVYDVHWPATAPAAIWQAAIRQFLDAVEVSFTRVRETKTQQLNARALVYDLAPLANLDEMRGLRMTVSVGPQGTIRPEEVLTLLGDPSSPETVHTHRVALLRSVWRRPSAQKQHRPQ